MLVFLCTFRTEMQLHCILIIMLLLFHSYRAQVLYSGHRATAASPAHESRAESMAPSQRAGSQQHGRVKHGRKQDRRDTLHPAPLRRRGSPDEAAREGHGARACDAEDAEEHERLPAALPPGRARLCRPPPEDRTEVVVAWWCHRQCAWYEPERAAQCTSGTSERQRLVRAPRTHGAAAAWHDCGTAWLWLYV